jgi:hypothetical protein
MSRRHNAPHIYEDPNIAAVARIEATRIWGEIENVLSRKVASFHHEREKALAYHIPRISKEYGKEVARRVESAIMTRDPATRSKACRGPFEAMMIEYVTKKHGRYRKRDRFCMWLFGLPL